MERAREGRRDESRRAGVAVDVDLLSIGILCGAAIGLKSFVDVLRAQGYIDQGLWRLSAIELRDGIERSTALALVVVAAPVLLGALLRVALRARREGLARYVIAVLPAFAFLELGQWAVGLPTLSAVRSVRGVAVALGLLAAALFVGWRIAREPLASEVARRSSRALRAAAAAVIALTLLLHLAVSLGAWWTPPSGPNIVLIYFDTLRADHLGSYGYSRPTSPNIDRLAREGVLFRNVTSQAPVTYPSVPSTLTSKYASEFFDSTAYVLRARHLTLAEILREHGYRTAGFSSSAFIAKHRPKSPFGGYEQGFESFDDSAALGGELNWRWRSPEAIIDRALSWLDRRPRGKFFLFLYIIDPHDPYRPPEPYDRMYDPDYRGKEAVARGEPDTYEALITRGYDPGLDAEDVRHLSALYDGEITYADAQVGRLLERLSSTGLDRDTAIVFTSDHGEEFYDHGGLRHRLTLYRELLHVPLILHHPGGLPRGVVVERPFVQSLDISPTILSIAGIGAPAGFAGRSLLPLISDPQSEWRDYALSEAMHSEAKALLHGRWKYIHHFGLSLIERDLSPRYRSGTELYDVQADPEEKKNVLAEHPEVARDLHAKMLSLLPEIERRRIASGNALEVDDATREQLRALGYLH